MHEPRDLIDAMRRVNTAARIAELDGEDFTSEIQQLHALADRLDALAVDDIRMQASLWHDDLAERMAENLTAGPKGRINRAEVGIAGFFPYSPYVGTLNPIAPPIDFVTVVVGDRAEVHATHTFEAIMNGPPGGVHGGVVAGVFDELLGCTCVVNDVSPHGNTLHPLCLAHPLGVPITMRAGSIESRAARPLPPARSTMAKRFAPRPKGSLSARGLRPKPECRGRGEQRFRPGRRSTGSCRPRRARVAGASRTGCRAGSAA